MYTDILVVADGTDTAVSHALDVSDASGAKLHALYIFDPSEADVLPEKERAGAIERAETAGTEETGRVAELAAERGIDTARHSLRKPASRRREPSSKALRTRRYSVTPKTSKPTSSRWAS